MNMDMQMDEKKKNISKHTHTETIEDAEMKKEMINMLSGSVYVTKSNGMQS